MTAAAPTLDAVAAPTALPAAVAAEVDRARALLGLRITWLRHLWRDALDLAGTTVADAVEVDAALDGADDPHRGAAWLAASPEAARWRAALADASERPAGALARIADTFGLDDDETGLLGLCLAVAVEPSLARLCVVAGDGTPALTGTLAARLLGHGHVGPWAAESPLFAWQLVHRGPGGLLACDPGVRDRCLEIGGLDPALVGIAALVEPRPPLGSWPLTASVRAVEQALAGGGAVRLTIAGPDGSGRRTFAACLARELGLLLLVVDTDPVDRADRHTVFARAQRQAFLDRLALCWVGDGVADLPWRTSLPLAPLQVVIAAPGRASASAPGIAELTVDLPAPTAADRRTLWHATLGPAAADASGVDRLAQRHRVTVGDLVAAAATGPATVDEAAARVREGARRRFGDLAQRLETPFAWDDLVVPDHLRETLADLTAEAGARVAFWDDPSARRLFPQGRGLAALFSGPPGTGKTMAAQVVAAALDRDLYRVDLASVVSKYVGETAENLDRLLTAAAATDVVLLFDEADALYGRRTGEVRDAQDRYANYDTGHLLTAVEAHDGVVILATNLKANIDTAFLRRLRYVVEFPLPDVAERLAIWRRVTTSLAGGPLPDDLDGALVRFATDVKASGAQIKFAVLSAVLAARQQSRPLGADLLLRGLHRELTKDGRGLSDRDRDRLLP